MSNSKSDLNIDGWSDRKVEEWISSSAWNTEIPFKPDASINKRRFVQQNLVHEEAWKAAIAFLKRADLFGLRAGRYDLSEDDSVYASITEYQPKNPETTPYEAHRKFIDIQCVLRGEEYMEVLPLEAIKEEQKYDEEKDIILFKEKTEGTKLYADTSRFFIFFPEDVHKPGLKVGTFEEPEIIDLDTIEIIKKVIVKVRIK